MDLACGFDEVLQMGPGQKVAQVDEFTVVLILDIDDTPSVLTATDLLAIDNNVLLATDNSEGDNALKRMSKKK